MSKVITSKSQLDFTLQDLAPMDKPGKMFLVRPTYFTVDYVINPHMEGNIGKVDKIKAMQQWESVRDAFAQSAVEIHEVQGAPKLPDMVFCANQSLPFIGDNGNREVIMSIMNSEHRKREVPLIEEWYLEQGYQTHHLNYKQISNFEGAGDALWHSGKRLLWGGYGFRTSIGAYDFISDTYKVPVIALKLNHPEFYHLDTCFCVLNETTALYYPGAFDQDGIELIRSMFETLIEVPESEALNQFACNAACPDGKLVVLQQGATETNKKLREAGFDVVEVETSEFLKSGGSVFCMKMMAW